MYQDITNIIQGCQQNQQLMQKELYKHCYASMMKVCSRYTNDEETAASIYNDAMLKVFNNIHNYKEEGKIMGWVKTITVNTCIDYIRKKSPIVVKEYTEIYEGESTIDNEVIAKLSNVEIKKLINKLPKTVALVFNLYVYEQYNHNEIAAILNIPSGTSRYYLSEARSQLKILITQNYYSLNTI